MTSTTPPAARRINRGRGHSYTLDGQPITGVTTIINEGVPKPALVGWAAGQVADFVVARRSILPELSDGELRDLARGAPNRERDAAANRGNEVHRLASRLAAGHEVDVPDAIAPHVDSYLGFLTDFEPANALLERPCFNTEFRYGGTFDLWAEVQRGNLGRCLFDVKTSGKGINGEIALQLAAYGRCEFYLDEELQQQPMPEVDHYVAVWVRADGYDAYRVEVGEQEWRTFRSAAQIAWWRKWRSDRVVGESMWSRMRLEAEAS